MIRAKKFQKIIYSYYKANKRVLPWRNTKDPYKILVSEVMLQQTQVKRVLAFYAEFTKHLPTIQSLAAAPISKVLKLWQGLGYNRRALLLQRAAQSAILRNSGKIPKDYDALLKLPGVGPSTAAGIMNFAFGVPTPYLETNVRSVYLHFFFPAKSHEVRLRAVADKDILKVMLKMFPDGGVPRGANPSTWFYALLDYGVMLKKTIGNPNTRSAHYAKQSPFEGSTRQARAAALRKALKSGASQKHLLRLLK